MVVICHHNRASAKRASVLVTLPWHLLWLNVTRVYDDIEDSNTTTFPEFECHIKSGRRNYSARHRDFQTDWVHLSDRP
jgi:hypothetical protein